MNEQERGTYIERYAAGAALIRAAIARAPAEALLWRPSDDEFSAHEVVVHCADSETNAAARIRYIVASPDPVVLGYDPWTWSTVLDYRNHPLDVAVATIEAVRANTLPLLRALPSEAWERAAMHTESGRYTADDWVRIYASHLEEHAQQIDAALAAWERR